MKSIWIIFCILLFGCNNSNNEKSIEESEMDDISVESNVSSKDAFEKSNFNQLRLIEEKLQEAYDLLYLSEKNSDFESTIKSSTLINSIIILDSSNVKNAPMINNLYQIGKIETVNDSINYINFSYTLKQGSSEKRETLKAIIKKKSVSIEGISTTSIKINFNKYDD